jgi:PQQ-like domain
MKFFLFVLTLAVQSTSHYSNARLGSISTETILTPSNVKTGTFGHLTNCPVDGPIYGQPLYVTYGGQNLLIVATMNDSIYAFDPNSIPCLSVWSNLVFDTTWSSGFPQTPTLFNSGNIGCVATPVVDTTNGFVYALCANNTPNWVLWKFNLSTGATINSVVVAPSVAGTGDSGGLVPDNVSGGTLSFYPTYEICRGGLTLANSTIYVTCGSFNDIHPWHGWVVGYNASSLAQTGVWCSTPNGGGGGVWMGGMVVDGSGNLYGVTGNGNYDGSTSFSMSAVKLSSTLSLLDWFTPSNWSALSSLDIDLGSSQAMLLPGTAYISWGAKDFNVYTVNTACMGHLAGTVGGCTAPQVFLANPSPPSGAQGGIWMDMFMNGMGYFSNSAYVSGTTDDESIYQCSVSGFTWNTTCTASVATWQYPGAAPSGSINATSNGIIWLLTVATNAHSSAQPATLRAVNASTFSEYWNSGAGIGNLSKFVQPTVMNGKVYVSTLNQGVQVFGLLSSVPSSVMQGQAKARGQTVIH